MKRKIIIHALVLGMLLSGHVDQLELPYVGHQDYRHSRGGISKDKTE